MIVDYTSKYDVELEAESVDDAGLRAMRLLNAHDPEAGPVGYVVLRGDEIVADKRAWRARKNKRD